jgi:hypothetical protein
MFYFSLVWCALAVVVLSMAGYRKMIARGGDALVHLGTLDGGLVNAQRDVAERLGWIDQWGKILTLVTVVLGLVLVSYYLYGGWIESMRLQHLAT